MPPELRNRLLFGTVLAAGVVGAVAWDLSAGSHWGVLVLGLLSVVLGAREFRRLARTQAAEARLAPVVVVGVALVLEAHLHALVAAGDPRLRELQPLFEQQPVALLLIGLGLIWAVLAQLFRYATEHFFANLGATLFGMVYLGLSFNLLQRLALLDGPLVATGRGTALVLVFLAAVKCGDITAYFGGRLFGRYKMSPRISPGKTWEGFACSFIGAIGGSYAVAAALAAGGHPPFAGWWQPAVWGLVLGPLGVAGDLAESAMKRDAAVKDSGAMVPGFGGLLDLLDALILAAPVAYLLALVL